MRKIWMLPAIVLMFALVGCSSTEEAGRTKPESAVEKPTDKNVDAEKKIEAKAVEPVAEKPAAKEEIDWEGNWVFLSDDNLGLLKITKTSEDGIQYNLTGSAYNSYNGNSYGNAFEGPGKIAGNKIEFTDDLTGHCSGVMTKDDNMITVKFADESCHTPAVYLDGTYRKEGTATAPEKLVLRDGNFVVAGVALGDSLSVAKSYWDNPEYEGPDEDGFYLFIQKFPAADLMLSYDGDDTVESIVTSAGVQELDTFAENFDGEIYADEQSVYLFNPKNGQLLIYADRGDGNASILVTMEDGNFRASVENGWIQKKN